MFKKHYHGTHPAMMDGASNQELRDRYLATELFVSGEIRLHYVHNERFVIGGVVPAGHRLALPVQLAPMSAKGKPFLERREIGVVNIGGTGTISVDGAIFTLENKECLYIPMGCNDVYFEGADARFYLASLPAHKACTLKKISMAQANPLKRGDFESANQRTIYQLVIPSICESAQLLIGLTVLEPGSIWNTMPPHQHDRRSEIYLYFNLQDPNRVFHFMGEPDAMRHIVVKNEEAVISPPWSVHMGSGTRAYAFIWVMGGENQDYTDMNVLDVCQLQ
jgi:4-deoxy-L-threo-5-hexosulose-uronate ketol-isomerase